MGDPNNKISNRYTAYAVRTVRHGPQARAVQRYVGQNQVRLALSPARGKHWQILFIGSPHKTKFFLNMS